MHKGGEKQTRPVLRFQENFFLWNKRRILKDDNDTRVFSMSIPILDIVTCCRPTHSHPLYPRQWWGRNLPVFSVKTWYFCQKESFSWLTSKCFLTSYYNYQLPCERVQRLTKVCITHNYHKKIFKCNFGFSYYYSEGVSRAIALMAEEEISPHTTTIKNYQVSDSLYSPTPPIAHRHPEAL